MRNEINWTDLVSSDKLTIETMWNLFVKLIMPKDAPDIQIREMKKAFYAGFIECFKIMSDVSTDLSESDAVLLFEKINKEAQTYIKETIGAGS